MGEAVEFAVRTTASGPWIPLRLTWCCPESKGSYIVSRENIRGYDVETHGVPSSSSITQQQVTLCGEDLLPSYTNTVQFRWMNTANEPGRNDMWALFNVTADLINSSGDAIRIFDTEWVDIANNYRDYEP